MVLAVHAESCQDLGVVEVVCDEVEYLLGHLALSQEREQISAQWISTRTLISHRRLVATVIMLTAEKAFFSRSDFVG